VSDALIPIRLAFPDNLLLFYAALPDFHLQIAMGRGNSARFEHHASTIPTRWQYVNRFIL